MYVVHSNYGRTTGKKGRRDLVSAIRTYFLQNIKAGNDLADHHVCAVQKKFTCTWGYGNSKRGAVRAGRRRIADRHELAVHAH